MQVGSFYLFFPNALFFLVVDESVPFTKYDLDQILGVSSTPEEYR